MELKDLEPGGDVKGGAKRSTKMPVPKTPLPIKVLNKKLANKPLVPPYKLPPRPFPWRRLSIIVLAGIVIGNACVTLLLYAINRPEISAWTGHVPQSTPSAVNDLILGAIVLILAMFLLRKP